MCIAERYSISEIATLIGCSRAAVRNGLIQFGIKISCVLKKNKSQLRFGEKYVKGQVIEHKGETAIILKIRNLRDQGTSCWKIAELLNSWNIPTKSKYGKWHARTIQQILQLKS